jgi:hypothetical protein
VSKVDLHLQCGMPCSKLEVSTVQDGTLSGARYLHQSQSINCWHPPARKILLQVNQTPVDATMSWRGEVLFRRKEDAFGEFAPN